MGYCCLDSLHCDVTADLVASDKRLSIWFPSGLITLLGDSIVILYRSAIASLGVPPFHQGSSPISFSAVDEFSVLKLWLECVSETASTREFGINGS